MASEKLTRIVVEIADGGLDGRRDLLKLLTEATAEDQVQWTVLDVEEDEKDLGGLAEIILVAVTTKVADQLVEKVEAVVGPWCRRRMTEVRHRVRTEPVEAGPDGAAEPVAVGSAAPEPPAADQPEADEH